MKSGVYFNEEKGDLIYLFGGNILTGSGIMNNGKEDSFKTLSLQPFLDGKDHEWGEVFKPDDMDFEGDKPRVLLCFHNNGEIDHIIGLLENLKEMNNGKVQQK